MNKKIYTLLGVLRQNKNPNNLSNWGVRPIQIDFKDKDCIDANSNRYGIIFTSKAVGYVDTILPVGFIISTKRKTKRHKHLSF